MSSTVARGLIRADTLRPSSPVERGQRALLLTVSVLTVAAWLLTLAHSQSLTFLPGGAQEGAPHHLAHPGLADVAHLAATGMGGAGWSLAGVAAFVVALDSDDGGDDASCRGANDSDFRFGSSSARR